MKAKFFLQMMFLLCMGRLFSPKALANVLLTWGFLQSPCIKGCSCAGSTPGSVWKWRYASTGELAGRSSGFRNTIYESPTCYFPVGISSFLSRMSLGDLIPSNAETCCFSSSLRKNREPWGHHYAVHLFSYFLLVLFVFFLPTSLAPTSCSCPVLCSSQLHSQDGALCPVFSHICFSRMKHVSFQAGHFLDCLISQQLKSSIKGVFVYFARKLLERGK